MQTLVVFSVALALFISGFFNQPVSREENLCISRFVAPKYPPLARNMLAGDVRVRVRTDSDGIPADIAMLEGNPMLQQFVGVALKQWKFCDCSSATEFQLTFRFRLQGARTDSWAPTQIELHPSGVVDIITPQAANAPLR